MGSGFGDDWGKALGCALLIALFIGCLLGWGVSAIARHFRVHASIERVRA